MKKILTILCTAAALMTACTNDDQYSWDDNFADLTATDTLDVSILWNGQTVTISGDAAGYVTAEGADVTVRSATNRFLRLTLSGTSDDGSLTIWSWKKLGVVLNSLTLKNNDGPAINNQCGKAFHVVMAAGTTNTLADGASYADRTYDQKGTLFSEGQIYFSGTGQLTVNGTAKNGIASDDYIVIEGGTININVTQAGGRGIKVNDGITINGGQTTISTTGDCRIEQQDGVADTTSAAGIKSDSTFVMNAGTLTIVSSGDGGKGINCSADVSFRGGTLNITTTGSNNVGKPKGVKSDTAITVSGGSFRVTVSKSWACDNGVESDDPSERLTVVGTPTTQTLTKKSVVVVF